MRRLACLLALLALSAAACASPSPPPAARPGPSPAPAPATPAPPGAAGDPRPEAPDFSLATLDGGAFRLSDHLGHRPVLLNFWAPW